MGSADPHVEANPVKTGGAKLQGLRQICYGSQLPKPDYRHVKARRHIGHMGLLSTKGKLQLFCCAFGHFPNRIIGGMNVKKLLQMLLMLLLVLSLTCSSVMAAPADKTEKQYKKLCQMVDKANEKIDKLVEHAKKTEKDDVQWLLDKVEKEVTPVLAYAAQIGVEVECEVEVVMVDGQWVEIDPLKVINQGDTSTDEKDD